MPFVRVVPCRLLCPACLSAASGHACDCAAAGPEARPAAKADTGAGVSSSESAQWWLGAVELLVRTSPSQGDNVADHIKEQLMERDRQVDTPNATR